MQKQDFRMSIYLPTLKVLMNNYTKSTMRDRLCKSKIKVTTEDKNSIAYGIEYNDWEAGYLGESKRINLYDCEKNEIRKHCW